MSAEKPQVNQEQPPMTSAQVIGIVEQAERFFAVFQGLALVARSAQMIESSGAAALQRQQRATEAAETAERETKDKLELYAQKVKRASEESDRILAKANQDANQIVGTATAEAKEIRDKTKKAVEIAGKIESGAKARTAELTRTIGKREKTLADLDAAISAAKEKIASFQK